ncbi:proliferation marker protein Ki-67 [Glossophaga mutica]
MGPAGRLVTIKRSGADGPHFPLSLSTCLFGRGVECDIRIQLPVVSRQHCKIEVNEQKAVLFNFSSANPTQVNGSAIDGPVQLRHGDVITVVDRSFRYEDDRRQSGSTSAAFPGQRHGQAAPRRVSRSSLSSDPDGEVEGRGAARSQLTEAGCVSGEPPARMEGVGAARAVSRSSAGPATRSPPEGHRSGPLRDDCRNAVGSPAGGLGEGSRGTLVSKNGGPEALPSPWCLEKGGEKESPFRKLYESMKEKLDVKSEKENVLQNRRKSGSRGHCAANSESAGGSWGETPPQGSPKRRRRSRRSSQTKAVPAPGQREEERTGEGPGLALEAPGSPGTPPMETTKGGTPGRRSHQNSSRKRRSGGQSGDRGREPVNLEQSAALTPKPLFPGQGTPTEGDSADGFGSAPETVFSRKRRSSFPPKVDILAAEAELPKPAVLTPLLAHVERKVPGGSLGAAAGSPGLHAIDVRDLDESIHKTEGVPSKTRRVSFGGRLRPELFDENLPPNTPLKRGETPMKRRSLVTHAPAVLKKIIKGQPQESGKEDSSEIHLEVTAQNVFVSSPACCPTKSSSVANGDRRRSSQPPAPSGSPSPPEPDAPRRGGRRSSSGAPSRRASVGRGRHGVLQMVQSRRRSGASEANLIVAKSWADIVKLSAKQTQAKAVKRGPPRQPSKRQRRAHTPKKPTGHVYSECSTGHANSPCTIVIGKAHVEKVAVPARPYRMLNGLVFNRKIDFSEDLSGLTEMFKTPAKEKPKKMSLRLTAFSNSEGLFGRQFQVPKSEGEPPPRTPAKSGENAFPSAQDAPEEPSDKKPASPALRRQCGTVNKNVRTPPSETGPSKTASSGNKSRRSAGLRNSQVPGAECEKEGPELDTVESLLGRCLRKSPAQAQPVEGEMKERERAFAAWERDIDSKENSEKGIVVRRSRRSSELNRAPRTDVIAMKRLQETESKEDLVGIHCLPHTPGHAEAPVDTENKATTVCCRSPKPEPVSTPAMMNGWVMTPSQRVSAEALSVLRKPTQTPGDTKHTHKEPVGIDESMNASKKTPEQQQNSAEHVIGSRRRPRTPKKKPQSIEDLTGFKELFQTPNHVPETVTKDRTTKVPSKSPKPEPVSTPTSTKRGLRTPLRNVEVEEELSALRKSTPSPGETIHSPRDPEGDDEDIGALKGTPEQKRDSAEHVTGSRRRSRISTGKVEPIEDLTGFKELFQTPHHVPETPEQEWDSAEHVTLSRRRSRTPKRKAELTEDLTGFKELFQTPSQIVVPMTEDKTMKMPSKSPKPEPVSTPTSTKRGLRTPLGNVDVEEELSALRKSTPSSGETIHSPRDPEGDDEDIRALKGTPEQKWDSAEHVTGSRRRSRISTGKVEPIEDLTGFKELFQTPHHVPETVTKDRTTKVPSKSPKPEPVSTPTSTKRGLRTPLRNVEVEEELLALRKSTPSSGETIHSPRDPEGDDEDIGALKGTPEQKQDSAEHVTRSRRRSRISTGKVEPIEDLTGFKELFQTPHHVPETPEQEWDSAEHVTGSRRRSRTRKRKVEPTEDLTGFKELFQTPHHVPETVTKDRTTKVPSKSPKPEPVSTPTSTKRGLRTPLRNVEVEEELLALRKSTPSSGETIHSPRDPEGDDEDIGALKGTPEQKQDSAEHVTRSRRRSRISTGKVEPIEDLTGFKELFQTPHHVPETPEQEWDSAEHVTGSRRRSRTRKRKVEPTEDLTGFKELFQTPHHVPETVTKDRTTKVPSKSPKPEPVSTPTSTKRGLRTPPRNVEVEEELLALRKSTPSSGETIHSPRDSEGDDQDNGALKGTPEQKRDSAEHVTGSRRRSRISTGKVEPIEDLTGFKELFQTPHHVPETPEQEWDSAEHVTLSRRRSRTPKRKAELTEDLTGFKELFQTPSQIVVPMTEDKTMKMPSKSPKPEPVSTPTSTKRGLRTPLGNVDVEEELSALRKSTPSSGETIHSPRDPEGDDEDIRALKGTPEQKWDSAEHVTGSRRRSRISTGKVEPIEDLTGFKELFQTPHHVPETVTKDRTTKVPSKSPKPEPVSTPTSTKRGLRTPLRNVEVEEELLALRKSTPSSGETIHSPRDPEGDDEDIGALKGTPEQKQDSAEHVTRSRRRSRISTGKVEPIEDLTGFKELFQTPHHVPETPEQEWDSAEHVTGSRRRSRTRKRKVEPTEDLTGFKELFQTPHHVPETVTKDRTTKVPSKSPKPEPVSTPTSTKRGLRTPLRNVEVEEELLALRKSTPSSGETIHSPRDPEGDDEDIGALKGTPEQKQDSAEHVTRSRRRSRISTGKVEPIEDLTGFKELFQTPHHVPETPEQEWDSAEHVTGSRRRSRTRKRKVEPTEDLTGFKELFQTPHHVPETVTKDRTTKVPSKSPKPEPVSTPTSTKRGLRTPPRNVEVEEELLALRKSTPSSGETIHSPRDSEGDDQDNGALKGTPEQKRDSAEHVTGSRRRSRISTGKVEPIEDLTGFRELFQTPHHVPETSEQKWDSAEHVTGSRRRSRTPKRKVEPTEDLTGFKELFQTPRHTVESMFEDKATEMPCKSAQAKPAVMPAGRNRQLKAPPGKVAVKDELSVLWSPAQTLRRTTRSHREPEGVDKDVKSCKESPEQKPDPAENVAASKRRPRTRKEKAQFLQDPASLKELLQTPEHTEDPGAVANSPEMPSGPPQAEAVVRPARTRRQLRAPPATALVQEEPSGLRRPTGTAGKSMRSHGEQEGVDKDVKSCKESPEQKLDPAENVAASKRRPRTRKEKAQFLEDPASLKELLQTPEHTEDPGAVANSTEMPSGPPQAEAVVRPARTRRQLRAPPATALVQEEPSGLRRPTGTAGKSMRSHREPVDGAKDTEVRKGPPRREPGPAGNAGGSGRLLRSRKGRAQPPHSPADSRQLLQSPAQEKELGTDAAGVMRTSAQTPDQSKPVTTSRRAVRALSRKPTEELADSRDPVKSQSEGSVTVSPKRKREDGSCAGPRRLRPRTRAQDAAEEKPPRKRQRAAPREQCAPPEPSEPKRGRGVLREGMEPVEDLPSSSGKTKNKGRKEDGTSPDKVMVAGVSLRSRLPNKSKGAEQRPELLVSAEKAQRKRNEEKPVKPSREVGIQNPEGGAQNPAPGDKVHARRMSPRPGRRGEAPVPRGAEEEARARSVQAPGKTREQKEGAPRSGFICLRSRKVTVPPTGGTLESRSKQRVTRSAKRPVEDAGKEEDDECVKKMRTRSRRGQ